VTSLALYMDCLEDLDLMSFALSSAALFHTRLIPTDVQFWSRRDAVKETSERATAQHVTSLTLSFQDTNRKSFPFPVMLSYPLAKGSFLQSKDYTYARAGSYDNEDQQPMVNGNCAIHSKLEPFSVPSELAYEKTHPDICHCSACPFSGNISGKVIN